MVDRRKGIEGNTLKDKWEKQPDPPTDYGKSDPQVIVEQIGAKTYAWSTVNVNETIDFYGDSVSVAENELENRPSND